MVRAIALICAFFSFQTLCFAADAPIVNVIEFRGLARVDEATVRAKLTQDVGEPLDYGKVSDDIKALYGMGSFEDVHVEMEMFEGGLKMIFDVAEKPTVAKVEFQGNDKIDDAKLSEKLTVTSGSTAEVALIRENADKLLSFYQTEGYHLAAVVPVVRRTASRAYLTYLIDEGPKVKIRKLTVTGNKAIRTDKIKRSIKTARWGVLSFLSGGGYYEKSRLDADVEKIKEIYQEKGYIKASVAEPELKMEEDRRSLELTLRITEGQQYRTSSIAFSGNTAFTDEELRDNLKSSPGGVLNKKLVEKDVFTLSEAYSDRGYAMVNIRPDIIPDEAETTARVVLRIYEGDIYHIGRIEISGNRKTRDRVIRREMKLMEGDRFSITRLRKSYRDIANLNLFEELSLNPEPDRRTKTMDIGISMKERPSGMLSVGGGYSSIDKWVGTLDLTEGNLGGRGQIVKLKLEFSERSTLYEASFTEPYLFRRPISLTASVYDTSREYTDYTKRAQGLMFGLGRNFSDYWKAGLSYRLEAASIGDIAESASSVIKEQEGRRTTSSVTPYISRDTRDSFLDPHTGTRNHLSLTYAGLGGDNRFIKSVFDSSLFIPLGVTTFSLRGRYGYAAGVSGRELPLYERFYVGGIYTVRGLGFGDAGPKGPAGDLIGGTEELIFNAEYIFPLISEVNLKGIAFYDLGSSFDKGIDLKELRNTTGFGLRWISPIGPLRLEWGYNIEPRAGEKPSRWDFTIGTFF